MRNGAQKCGMMTRNLEHQFFLSVIENYIRYSALQCHLAAAFCFIINVAWFIFSDLSSDAWAFSCVYTKRYIIYGQNSQSQEFQQNNLLKSCIGSLVESENCHRTASPPDLAHCGGVPPISAEEKIRKKQVILVQKMTILALLGPFYYKISIVPGGRGEEAM